MTTTLSRRHFTTLAAASTLYSLLPARVFGANDRVNVAFIGCGGMGKNDAKSIAGSGLVNVVALCDVAIGSKGTQEIEEKFPRARKFSDFRKMFDAVGNEIDAVTVATPDHSHFPIAMLAMSLGKHVYVEKPLSHTFQEAELMMAAEKKYKAVAQVGNQGHSGANYFQFKAWTEAGIIKDVTRITAYMNKGRRWHGWTFDEYPKGEEIPAGLDWDTWLGPRPYRDYSGKLHPGNWRSWFDFGNGAFGDWGPHTLDTAHRFLKLGLPTKITAIKRDGVKKFIFPLASTISFSFPARGEMPPVDVTWYDGTKNRPPRPDELEPERKLEDCGKVIYGKDLVFKGTTHGSSLRIIPESKMRDLKDTVPRITGKHSGHHKNFLLACKGEEKTRSSFDVAGPLTQVFCLGVIAQRLGGELTFDPGTKQFTDNKIANELLVGPPPRKGWEEFYRL